MTMSDFHSIEARGIAVTLDLRAGHVRRLTITRGGRTITPLHSAPWVDDPVIINDESIPANLRYLSGDFFCAPFGASDVDPAPPHGWTANSHWSHFDTTPFPGGVTARYRLDKPVMGAAVEKHFTLRDGHPFLYETHVFTGGKGALPVANHAMTRFPGGGQLSFSRKAHVETPPTAPEPDPALGRSRLAYPARSATAVLPLAAGGSVDISRYPFADRHEDLVLLVEDQANPLGWIAAQRPDSRDMFVSLKRPTEYPVTVLWFSNGGRDYAPWNSRHIGVLGMEEGRTSLLGHRGSIEPNSLSDAGTPTALTLRPAGSVALHNVVGGLPFDPAAGAVANIAVGGEGLVIDFAHGPSLNVPFDTAFLASTKEPI